MADEPTISVEVVYALPERQRLVRLDVATGASARQAALAAGLEAEFPGLDVASATLGIFGVAVAAEHVLTEGDRVEIYRPLPNDPRVQRRKLAARGKNMGRQPG